MAAFPTTGLAVHVDVETLALYKDAGRTQLATTAGDAILAMGDASSLDPVGAALTPGAGLTLGFIGTKKGLKFPGTAAVGVNITPANGFPQFNGDYLPITMAFSFLYPAEAAGAVRYLQRLYNTGGNHLYNVYYPDARLGTARRIGSSAQVFTPIETVGTKDQRQLLIVRYSYPGTGTNMVLDAWLDKGDGNGSVRVLNGVLVAGQTIQVNTLRLGDNFNGLIRRYALWSVALSDTDVNDTMASMATNTPIVANTPAITITNDAQLRGFSTRQGAITLSGSFANVTGTVASISTRVIRVSDGATVRTLAASGATISGTTFTGLSFDNGPATPLGTAYQREFVLLDAGGVSLATIRPSTTYVVGWVVAFGGSSTAERASYEYTGTADPNLWVYTPEQFANYKQNDTAGAGVHSFGATRRAATGEQIIITNYGRGSTTLHYHAISDSEGAPGTVVTNLNPFQVWINGYALCKAIPDELVLTAGANDTFKPYEATNPGRVRSRQLHQAKWVTWLSKINALFGRTDIPVATLPPNNRVNDLTDAPIGSDASARATMARGGEMAWARAATKARVVPTLDLGLQSADIHFGESGNNTAYSRAASALAAIASNAAYAPRIVSAAFVSDGAEITVQHSSGSGFGTQPGSGWAGFRVYDETGARVTIGTVATLSATKVKVPFTRDPAKAYIVSFCDGTSTADTQADAIASQPNLLKDNNGLPIEPTITGVGEVMLGDGTRVSITN